MIRFSVIVAAGILILAFCNCSDNYKGQTHVESFRVEPVGTYVPDLRLELFQFRPGENQKSFLTVVCQFISKSSTKVIRVNTIYNGHSNLTAVEVYYVLGKSPVAASPSKAELPSAVDYNKIVEMLLKKNPELKRIK